MFIHSIYVLCGFAMYECCGYNKPDKVLMPWNLHCDGVDNQHRQANKLANTPVVVPKEHKAG